MKHTSSYRTTYDLSTDGRMDGLHGETSIPLQLCCGGITKSQSVQYIKISTGNCEYCLFILQLCDFEH
jgi:hypothetical protein